LKLGPKETYDLALHLRELEVIPNRDAPAKEDSAKQPFKDRQLEMALDYLRGQIKTASKAPLKKAG
jgi:hypothetical protein